MSRNSIVTTVYGNSHQDCRINVKASKGNTTNSINYMSECIVII